MIVGEINWRSLVVSNSMIASELPTARVFSTKALRGQSELLGAAARAASSSHMADVSDTVAAAAAMTMTALYLLPEVIW